MKQFKTKTIHGLFFLEVTVCSVASRNNYFVAGTRDCEIYGFELNAKSNPQLLVQGHHDTNLSALACHPRENIFATGGDDCSLRFEWNCFLGHKQNSFF